MANLFQGICDRTNDKLRKRVVPFSRHVQLTFQSQDGSVWLDFDLEKGKGTVVVGGQHVVTLAWYGSGHFEASPDFYRGEWFNNESFTRSQYISRQIVKLEVCSMILHYRLRPIWCRKRKKQWNDLQRRCGRCVTKERLSRKSHRNSMIVRLLEIPISVDE